MAAPMPLEPPVTSATRPAKRSSFVRATAASLTSPRGVRSRHRLPARLAAPRSGDDALRAPPRRRHPRRGAGRDARRGRRAGDRGDARPAGRGRAQAAGASSPRRWSGRRSSPVSPTRSCWRSTPRSGPAARPPTSSRCALPGWRSWERPGTLRSCARLRMRTTRGDCWRMADRRRSRRFAAARPRSCAREVLVEPWAELGLVAADGPSDPAPELRVVDGVVTRLDGRDSSEFDVIDRTGSTSRSPVRPWRSRTSASRGCWWTSTCRATSRAPRSRADAGQAGPRRRDARPGRADDGAEEAARPARPRQPGSCDEPEGEPRAAGGGRGGGRQTRVRRARDDGRRRPVRAAQRPRAARRLAGRAPGGDDAVRRRGAPEPRARDPRARHVRRDALRLRHRAGVRRRRRHPVVEGVPRLGLRVARA